MIKKINFTNEQNLKFEEIKLYLKKNKILESKCKNDDVIIFLIDEYNKKATK